MREDENNASPFARASARAVELAKRGLRRTPLGQIEQRLIMLERIVRGGQSVYLGNNRVAVKVMVGKEPLVFVVQADDRLITPRFCVTGTYETAATRFLSHRLRSGDHCVDAGANFGYFTCVMGRFAGAGRVIGVEPVPELARIARDNIAANGLLEIAVIREGALAAEPGALTLHRRDTRSGNTSIIPAPEDFTRRMGEDPAEPFTTTAFRIDDLLPDLDGRLDLLKIDVEGAEPLVFQGARAAFASNPQMDVILEWSPQQIVTAGFALADFIAMLEALALRPFDLLEHGLAPLSFSALHNLPYRAGILLRGPASRD